MAPLSAVPAGDGLAPGPKHGLPLAGHADILREGVGGRTGLRAEHEKQLDEEARAAYCAKIEQAARSAAPIEA